MVDFEKHREQSLLDMYRTGGAAAGGLTVRDYFAAKAMAALIEKFDESCAETATEAYEWADAMMEVRDRKEPETMTLEEAFGFDVSFVEDKDK